MERIRTNIRPLLSNLCRQRFKSVPDVKVLSSIVNGPRRQLLSTSSKNDGNEDWRYHNGYWIPLARFGPIRRLKIYTKPPSPQDRARVAKVDSWVYSITVLCALGGTLFFALGDSPNDKLQIFSAPRFTPFMIMEKEEVSTTSFIITVRPEKVAGLVSDPYEQEWKRGTWSVEFKQPQLQIARSYTPLPPANPSSGSRFKTGDLRFLIRKEEGGEVSNYLASLPVGGRVELRGPHAGIELPGHITDVLFLAGGTGIAPAMQVAHTLLQTSPSASARVHIVWANRRREDCLASGSIVRELQYLQMKYPDKLRVDYFVDEEGTAVDQKKLSALTKNNSPGKSGSVTTRIDSKLLFVSGPEGFVNFLAGPKKWENGKETQGELCGLLKRLGLRDWKVWKL